MTAPHFSALVLEQNEDKTIRTSLSQLSADQLPAGDVLVAIDHSSLNYKDAMALTGTGKIIRKYPMVPGIDFAGCVLESATPTWRAGDRVILTGWGVGERHWGGYSQQQRTQADWLVALPEGMSSLQAMTLGTAGLTAMLCKMALEDAGITSGKVVVTGAGGGVGSVAIALLARAGYDVVALTQRPEESREYLMSIGAADVIGGSEWRDAPAALASQRWDAAVDVVGGTVLARLLSEMNYGGAVAACGLAGGVNLATTVMPFILRGVRLLGVDSVMCPTQRRQVAWSRLATELPESSQAALRRVVGLAELPALATQMMAGKAHGRVVVDLNA